MLFWKFIYLLIIFKISSFLCNCRIWFSNCPNMIFYSPTAPSISGLKTAESKIDRAVVQNKFTVRLSLTLMIINSAKADAYKWSGFRLVDSQWAMFGTDVIIWRPYGWCVIQSGQRKSANRPAEPTFNIWPKKLITFHVDFHIHNELYTVYP